MSDTFEARQDEAAQHWGSEAALQRFLDTAATGLVRITRDLRYQSVNSAYGRLVGMAVDQIIGRTMGEVIGDAALAEIRPYLDRALTGEHIEYEVQLPLAGSGARWIHVICTPESDASGRVIGWVSSVTDITERKRVENALRESERLQRLLAHVGELATSVVDTDDLIAAIGERIATEFGVLRCGFARVNVETGQIVVTGDYHGGGLALSPVYSIGDYPEGLRVDLLAGRTIIIEDMSTDPRTAPFYETTYAPLGMRAHLSVPLLREGRWMASFWISQNQTRRWTPEEASSMRLIAERVWTVIDRAWAEDTLRASEARFRATFENAAVGIAHVAVDGRWLRVNDRLCEIVGYSREQLLAGMTFQDITHPEDLDIDLELVRQVLSGERQTYSLDKRYFRANGSIVWVTLTVSLLRAPDGAPVHFISFIEDITSRKRAEEALREADQRKDEFLALLAHELRNPLAPIRTSVGLMRARPTDDPVLMRCREVIDRQVSHMARLLDDLLDVSRLSRGQLTLQRKVVGLREILDAAIEASMPLIVQQGQELAIESIDESITLDADAARLTQVFGNLLNNAAKYSASGSGIQVSVRREENVVDVTVQDRGMGIAPEMLERVFDLFTQADAAQAHAPGGLGIGLSLARRLVEMHDGTIVAASGGLGHGSEFTVRLPIARGARPAEPAPAVQPDQQIAPLQRRVLVVDDNGEAADMLAMLLTEVGCEVHTAYRGETAISEADRFRPDLVLLDIGLPDISGEEVCRRIRAFPWGAAVVIVAVTGWGQEHDRLRSAVAGFDQHLVKPVDPDVLVALTRELRERVPSSRATSP
jgi:PAS domain S-box-containing protein